MHNGKNENMPASEKDTDERYILGTVDTALSLLNMFFDHEELSVMEAAKLLEVSRSTAFRFMVTLEKRGFLIKGDNARYRLGLNTFSLGMLAYNRMELVSLLHPHLVEMAEFSGETCHASLLDDVYVMFFDRAIGNTMLKMDTAVGYREYAHRTATGKAILAYQPDAVVERYIRRTNFDPVTPKAITGGPALRKELERIRFDGFSCDDEEAEPGLTCFAMPLLDRSGRSYAAVSISGPTTRMRANREAHLALLERSVKQIVKW